MTSYDGDGIWIDGNSVSSKNSKVWTGKFLVNSKAVQKYKKVTKPHFIRNTEKFLNLIGDKPFPIRIGLEFARESKHRFDYINAAQMTFDLMTEYGWIPDDNADYVIPVFIPYSYDKETPGVFITIL